MSTTKPKEYDDEVDIDLCGDEVRIRVPLRKREREEPALNPNSKPDGTPIHPEGTCHIGQVDSDGYYTGLGEMTHPNGPVYMGNLLHGYFHGQGQLKNPDGSLYVGEFVNGKLHGKGTLEKPGLLKYEGQFCNRQFHGEGTLTTNKGLKYSGSFFNGKMNGVMTVTFPDGMTLKGYFRGNELIYAPLEITHPDGKTFSGLPSSFDDLDEIKKKLSAGDQKHQTEASIPVNATPNIDLSRRIKAVFKDDKLIVTDASPNKKPAL